MLVNKSLPDPIILPQTLHHLPHDNPLNLDPYQNSLDFPELLPFASVPLPPLPKHDDANGEGNSLKQNSLKTRLKELKKIRSSSRQLTLEFESRIQRSSKGVLLRFSPFIHLIHALLTYALPHPSPSYMFHSIRAAFSYRYSYTLPSP